MSLSSELSLRNPIRNQSHETALSVVHTAALMTKEANRILAPFGLTAAQFNVLMLLKYQADEEGARQIDLVNMLLVNRANVTGLVDRMEKAGWLERRDDPSDRRVKCVRMTFSGREVLEKAESAYFGRLEKVVGSLRQEARKELILLLQQVREGVRS